MTDEKLGPKDTAEVFVAEATEAADGQFTTTAELMNSARQWIDDNEANRFGSRALAEAMRRKGVTKASDGRRRGWKGVRLR